MTAAAQATLLQLFLAETTLLLNDLRGVLSATATHTRRSTQPPQNLPAPNDSAADGRTVVNSISAVEDVQEPVSDARNSIVSAEDAGHILSALSALEQLAPITRPTMRSLGLNSQPLGSRFAVSSSPPSTPFRSATVGLFAARRLPRINPLSAPPLSTTTPHRHFWSERKLQRLETEASDPAYRFDPRKQAELYREMLKLGNHFALIDRYENQPQIEPASARYPAATREADVSRVQTDPECAKLYVTALAKEGDLDRLTEKFLAAASTGIAARRTSGAGASAPPLDPASVGEGREHWVRTDVSQWEKALGRRIPTTSSLSGSGGSRFAGARGAGAPPAAGAGQNGGPIQVVLSEAWSWSKFVRKLSSKVLYAVLLMTGLSVLLDQQGIIKSGMGGAEVEPNSLSESIKFADVQGVDEAKHELEEIVAFLKEPKTFMEVGGKLPKGVLLYGPPGTGKTHLARAVAGEAGVPFFQMSGSEFDELYVGVGARRVRELFAAAKKKAPCIVFIDELDAVGSKRSAKDQSYMRQTLNQLLVELDGFSTSEGVILIAATNTPEALDKALVRPGRFDRLVPVPLPDVKGRSDILAVHMKGVAVAPGVDTTTLARGTPGFSGADLANLINHAAIRASKDGAKGVRQRDLEWAKDKIIMGSERKSAVVTDHNKRLTAYHEGGHTLVALHTPGATPLHKVTVIPRGNALGVTVQLPEADKTSHTKRELQATLDVCMGGRVAEEIMFGPEEVTTGASSDLEKATSVAREMVLVYGMSDAVGRVAYGDHAWEAMSPGTKSLVESEVRSLLDASYTRATTLLKSHKEELHRLARALMEHETLDANEVRTVIKGGELKPLKDKLIDSKKEHALPVVGR
ncbi:hypothetical protein HDU89_002625 [Geranomyces variabilis]|nr:hypothetical protein HDU89_002625 [Geranomyces variabilis]